jgi:O-antigen/teichoic acid export membrane protein
MSDPSATTRTDVPGRNVGHRALLGRVFANAGILVTGKGANAAFTLAYLALAARALGIEGLGILILVHTYAQAVAEIAKFRSWEAVLRYGTPALQTQQIAAFQKLIKFSGWLDGASGIGATVLAILGSGIVASLLAWPAEVAPLATLYCLSIAFMTPATPIGLLRLFDRFDLLAVQSAIGSFVRLVGSAALLAVGGGVAEFLVLWFIATLLAGAALVGFAWYETQQRRLLANMSWSVRHLSAPFAGIWRFVWLTNLNTSVAVVSTHLATLLAGGLLGAAEAALFRIARELADAAAKPTKLLIPAIFPELARLAATGSVQAMRALTTHSLAIAAAAAVVCFLAIWLFGDLLLRLVAGEAAVAAHPVMLLLGAAALLTLWAFPLEPLLISVGLEAAALRARLVATLLYVPMLIALVPLMGLIGAGIAAVGASLLMVVGQIVPSLRWFAHQPEGRP